MVRPSRRSPPDHERAQQAGARPRHHGGTAAAGEPKLTRRAVHAIPDQRDDLVVAQRPMSSSGRSAGRAEGNAGPPASASSATRASLPDPSGARNRSRARLPVATDRAAGVTPRRRRPCGRPREVRTEPGAWRTAAPFGVAAEAAEGMPPCEQRGPVRRPRPARCATRSVAPMGARGRPKLRLPPVTTRPAAGCGMRETGSDRRQKRPSGQWRQGDC